MENIATVFLILLLLSASALSISLIFYLGKITKSIKAMEADVKSISFQLSPLVASATNLSEKLNALVQDAKEPVDTAKAIAFEVKDRVDTILDLEERIRTSIEKPVTDFSKNLSAILYGLNAFWNTYKKK
ncbi:MAG: hypothetical protein Q8903_08890 [Bacteroidota bacterium]|nr:hypothetical protein [Bacteroidota bacterium]